LSYGLGIDVGTAFVAAAVSRAGQAEIVPLAADASGLPSVVRVLADGSLAAGEPTGVPAHLFRRRLGDSTPMLPGSPTSTPGDLLTALLATTVERVTAQQDGPPQRVVVTFPAVWGPYRREQFAETTRRAGLPRERVTLITDAEAVATHYRAGQPTTGLIAVYDAGGSTFDATLVQATSAGWAQTGVPESLEWFGGVDIDDAVLQHLDVSADGAVSTLDPRRPDDAVTLAHLRAACVRAKELLSAATEVVIEAHLPRQERRITLNRGQVEQWVRPPLEAGLPTLRRVLDAAGVSAADLDTVLLVGGTARIPLLREMLTADLGREVVVPPEPQFCAALGAALVAGSVA
jgi:molecular chaperone DnaK (HSP70)